jgi:DNA-binding MarR family transcriptional regulator
MPSSADARYSRARDVDTLPESVREIYDDWEERGLPGTVERVALAYTIERVRRKIDSSIESALKAVGLTRSRFELLMHLSRSESGSYQLSHLSDLLVLHPASVTSLVDHSERLGFLERVRDNSDRRVVLAHITPKGTKAVRAGLKALAEVDYGVANVPPHEAERLTRHLLDVL